MCVCVVRHGRIQKFVWLRQIDRKTKSNKQHSITSTEARRRAKNYCNLPLCSIASIPHSLAIALRWHFSVSLQPRSHSRISWTLEVSGCRPRRAHTTYRYRYIGILMGYGYAGMPYVNSNKYRSLSVIRICVSSTYLRSKLTHPAHAVRQHTNNIICAARHSIHSMHCINKNLSIYINLLHNYIYYC